MSNFLFVLSRCSQRYVAKETSSEAHIKGVTWAYSVSWCDLLSLCLARGSLIVGVVGRIFLSGASLFDNLVIVVFSVPAVPAGTMATTERDSDSRRNSEEGGQS